MSILAYNIICSSNNSTIHKFIVIRVLLYQSEAKMRINHSGVWTTGNSVHYIMSNGSISHTLQNLRIFVQYIIAYAKNVTSFTKSLPYRSIRAMDRNYLHQAVGIDDNVSAHFR